MVLESLTTPEQAEKKPWDLIFIGALYGAIAVFLSIWVFKDEASIVMVLLTVMASLPLMYNTMRLEEAKDIILDKERTMLAEHKKALLFFICLFIGFVLAYSLAFIFLPQPLVTTIFDSQLTTINKINNRVSEAPQGASVTAGLFFQILNNNLKVLLFCLFFSFFYGAGAIFILTWNASVISAAIGNFFRTNIVEVATSFGLTNVGSYFAVYSMSIFRYFIHGIPEIFGYYIGAL